MTRNVSSRRITAALSLGVLTTTSLLALSVATASAAGGTVSVDFTQRGDHSWTVPQGVSQVTLWLNGAQGGSVDGDPHYGKGGLGARVYETVPVQEGQQLSIVVGGAGGEGYGGTGGGEAGGWASFHGGGGGGASRVLIGSTLVGVAGGGGGAAYGGNGGDSGHAGTSFTSRAYDGVGGGGGSTFNVGGRGSGGAPVTPHCGTAQPGFDGADGLGPKQQGIGGLGGGVDAHDRYNVWVLTGGGGGGGGYGGGGGGGGGAFCPGYFPLFGNAGGGGGGGSYVQPGLAGSSVHDGVSSGNGAVSLQFVDDDGPTAAPTVYPAPNAHGWNNTDVTVDWGWSDSVSQLDAHHCDQKAASGGATGVLDLTATCYDTLSNKGQATLQVRIDKTPPAADPLVVDGGVLWRWSDEGSYVDFQSCTTVSSVPRPAQPGVVTATCTDRAGNEATASLTTP